MRKVVAVELVSLDAVMESPGNWPPLLEEVYPGRVPNIALGPRIQHEEIWRIK